MGGKSGVYVYRKIWEFFWGIFLEYSIFGNFYRRIVRGLCPPPAPSYLAGDIYPGGRRGGGGSG